ATLGAGDGSELAVGFGGVGVAEFGVVEQVEVLDAELEVGFAVDREGAYDVAVPVGDAGTAQRALDDVAEAGAWAGLGRGGKGGFVEPGYAGRTRALVSGAVSIAVQAVRVSGLRKVPLRAVLTEAGKGVVGSHVGGERVAGPMLDQSAGAPPVYYGAEHAIAVAQLGKRVDVGCRKDLRMVDVGQSAVERLDVLHTRGSRNADRVGRVQRKDVGHAGVQVLGVRDPGALRHIVVGLGP